MTKKILFLTRSDKNRAYSIENIFNGVAGELRRQYPDLEPQQEQVPHRSDSVWSLVRNVVFARNQQADVLHVTGDIHYIVPAIIRKNKVVLTIHDIVPLTRLSKKSFKYWVIYYLWYKWPMRRADRITVVSEKTRLDLIAAVGSQYPIEVIPNFVDPVFVAGTRKDMGPEPMFLIIGGVTHKNVLRSVQALQAYGRGRLHLIGDFDREVLETLQSGTIPYKLEANLPQEAIVAAYQAADILLFPTLFEGFGMPIVEAQACGCAVLSSSLSPMQEVAGEGACLVDPYSAESIREGIQALCEKEDYRLGLVCKGYANAARYRLEPVAAGYHQLYLSLL